MTHALIIDDDKKNLGVLKQLLSMAEISYTEVADTTRLETMLDRLQPVDLVLLDLEMPDIDGYGVFQLLRSREEFQTTPIVACTVHTGEFHTVREMGFDGFISKPLDVDLFATQIDQILNGQAVWYAR